MPFECNNSCIYCNSIHLLLPAGEDYTGSIVVACNKTGAVIVDGTDIDLLERFVVDALVVDTLVVDIVAVVGELFPLVAVVE